MNLFRIAHCNSLRFFLFLALIVLLTSCERGSSPKIPKTVDLPSGKKSTIFSARDLGDNYAIVRLQEREPTSTPLFAFIQDGKVLFFINTNGSGYEVNLPIAGKNSVVIHSSNPNTPAELLYVTRFLKDKDGKHVQIGYDQFGDISYKAEVP